MKLLLFAMSSLLWGNLFSPENDTPIELSCSSLQVIAETKEAKNNQGEITLKASGGASPYKFVVFKSSGHLLTEDFTKSKFSDLKADTYQAIVVDDNGCKKQIEIKLQ
ncbi:MAG: hypothetical protein JSU09_17920 [Bacteroidetes bacterium]|nr:hypothetical protein [Bacteroidota bacterium]